MHENPQFSKQKMKISWVGSKEVKPHCDWVNHLWSISSHECQKSPYLILIHWHPLSLLARRRYQLVSSISLSRPTFGKIVRLESYLPCLGSLYSRSTRPNQTRNWPKPHDSFDTGLTDATWATSVAVKKKNWRRKLIFSRPSSNRDMSANPEPHLGAV